MRKGILLILILILSLPGFAEGYAGGSSKDEGGKSGEPSQPAGSGRK